MSFSLRPYQQEAVERVRQAFLDIAARTPDRYLVLDGSRTAEDLAVEIAAVVSALVGDP